MITDFTMLFVMVVIINAGIKFTGIYLRKLYLRKTKKFKSIRRVIRKIRKPSVMPLMCKKSISDYELAMQDFNYAEPELIDKAIYRLNSLE